MAALQSNLALRVASAAVLAPVAVGAAYFGGWPFAVFWAAAAIAVVWEWTRMAGFTSRPMRSGVVALVALALVALWLLREQALIWYVLAAGVAWWIFAFLWLRNFSFGLSPVRPLSLWQVRTFTWAAA